MAHSQRRSRKPSNPIGKVVRRGLTILLGTIFGIGAGAIGTYFVLSQLFGTPGRDNWGGAPIWLLLMAIGAGAGAILSCVLSIGWAFHEDTESFTVFEWLGLLLGALAGGAASQLISERYYFFVRCLVMAVIFPVCITVGRFVAGRVGELLTKTTKPHRLAD